MCVFDREPLLTLSLFVSMTLSIVNPFPVCVFDRELSILLETAEDLDVELFVSYVVNKAKWSPKYDIRVFSNDSTMKVSPDLVFI